MSKIKIAIIEDYKLTRVSLKTILNSYEPLEVVADAKDATSGLELIKIYMPDIVLMDIGLPGLNGIEATAKIKELYPDIKVIMLTTRTTHNEVLYALGAGAKGYCVKNISPEELFRAIESVYQGILWIDSSVSNIITSHFPKPINYVSVNQVKPDYKKMFTKREIEVLKLLVKGLTNSEIAKELIVSIHTAKAHICSILQKFDVKDRAQAAIKAIREGVV